ncbi:MAG: glycosyltransferase family 2 protein [Sterolibacterium sp.]|nr:glycosyltransferase family 2 protein [Sterolibacterium sp.]
MITVCFNSQATIEDTLKSVATQTYADVEHIIVDGGSSDDTMAIVNSHRGHLASVISEPDRGVYDAMNKGIALSSGDVVGFLNADDIYADPTSLESVAQAFEAPGVEACYADLVYVDKQDMSKIVRYWQSKEYRYGMCRTGWMPAHPTFFVRRHVYEKFGTFDLQYRLQSDFELTMRLLEVHRIKSVYIPRILVKMRTGGMSNNSYSNVLEGNLEAYRACQKHGMGVTPLFILRKICSRLPQFFARPPISQKKDLEQKDV